PCAGHAFLPAQKHGKGKIIMLGSLPSGKEGNAMLEAPVMHYAAEAAIYLQSQLTPGTIVAPRKVYHGLVWIIFNMDGKVCSWTLPTAGMDPLTNRSAKAG
ncbi:UNVERIFIED_CONTAM: beta-galactosidase, partial [Bacillus subtilis]